MKKIIMILMAFLIMPMVFGADSYLGTAKQNTCIQLVQTCDNCTSVNFTGVEYPDLTFETFLLEGENHGTIFNNTFCNTSQIGRMTIHSKGDLNGIIATGNIAIDITQSGLNFNNMLNEVILFSIVFIFLYLILVWAYNHVEKDVVMIVSFGILLMGVYIMIYGIASLKNDYTLAFSIINIGIGALFLIGLAIEKIREEFG